MKKQRVKYRKHNEHHYFIILIDSELITHNEIIFDVYICAKNLFIEIARRADDLRHKMIVYNLSALILQIMQ